MQCDKLMGKIKYNCAVLQQPLWLTIRMFYSVTPFIDFANQEHNVILVLWYFLNVVPIIKYLCLNYYIYVGENINKWYSQHALYTKTMNSWECWYQQIWHNFAFVFLLLKYSKGYQLIATLSLLDGCLINYLVYFAAMCQYAHYITQVMQ